MTELKSFDEAMVPTRAEVRARTNLLVQAWRFVVLNLKMVAMVRKGEH
ncbi:MAG: hypothetical protein K9G28_12010 [Candidatus Nanopelagicales bacterium]|jgi:hypothetical protein|nr:hypothetical protein [Candidatus Nanopelagicales bacterium]